MDYITIKEPIHYEEVINKSRFITHLFVVNSEDEAKERINEIKQLHKSATHNCSSYVVGDSHQVQKANDDGEPSGTAGIPMLETLKKEDVHNVVAIVTRYYGGIKLGTGGLIRAYQSGVSKAIEQVGKVHIKEGLKVFVTIPYDQTGKFEYELQSTPYDTINTAYTDKVTYEMHIVKSDEVAFTNFVNEQTSGVGIIKTEASLMLPFNME